MKKLLFVFDGAYAYSPKRYKAYQKYYPELQSIPKELKEKIDREKIRVSYTPLLDMIFKTDLPSSHEIYYYAQTSIKGAKKVIELSYTSNSSIDIIGYSWGGDAAMRFIRYLKTKNIKVNKVHTLDPIRRGLFFVGFINSVNGNSKYFTKEENVLKHYNIYQKTDRYSLPLIHLRGNYIDRADFNLNLSELDKSASHVNLHLFDEVNNFLISEG